MWVVIHMCMEKIQRISLYSYLYLKLAMFFLLSFMFFFNKIRERDGGTDSAWRWGGGWQILYKHVSKCKNDKTKLKKI
jgi:hypothetical protein